LCTPASSFAASDRLATTDLLEHAAALGLDVRRFARDLGTGVHARRVRHDLESAEASGVAGTPTFFVGGRRHTGPHDADTLASALLAEAGADAVPEPPEATAPRPTPPVLEPRRDEERRDPVGALPPVPSGLPETPDRGGAFPRLTDAQLARLERFGTRRPVAPGDILFRTGDRGHDFHVVLSGAGAIVEEARSAEQPEITVHGERRFLGELDLFSSQPVSRTALVIRDGEVLDVPRDRLRAVFVADAELRELVLRTFLVRRSMLLELAADLRIVGRPGSPDTRRLQDYADAQGLTAAFIDLEAGGYGDRFLTELGVSEADLPVVVLRTGRVLRNPNDTELSQALRTRD
jgi:NhaA family Na+:H+ antiporter